MKQPWKRTAGLFLLATVLILPALAAPRRGGGRGGQWSQILSGTVAAVNADAGSLSVQTLVNNTATSVTLLVPSTVPVVRYSTTDLSGLAVGDTIQVNGVPTALQATAIQAGTPGDTGSTTTGNSAGTTGGTENAARSVQGMGRARNSATVQGTVQSIDAANNTVVVALSDDATVTVTVTVPAGLQIVRHDTVTLAEAQAGDLVWAQVSVDAAGNVTATHLELKAATASTGTTTGSGG